MVSTTRKQVITARRSAPVLQAGIPDRKWCLSSHLNNPSRLSPKGISRGSSLISQVMLTSFKWTININYHGLYPTKHLQCSQAQERHHTPPPRPPQFHDSLLKTCSNNAIISCNNRDGVWGSGPKKARLRWTAEAQQD